MAISNQDYQKESIDQISFANKQLKIKIKRSPLLIRLVLFAITFLCIALPLMGIILNATEGNRIKFGGIIALGLFSLIGFYLLRVSLWNHGGEEII